MKRSIFLGLALFIFSLPTAYGASVDEALIGKPTSTCETPICMRSVAPDALPIHHFRKLACNITVEEQKCYESRSACFNGGRETEVCEKEYDLCKAAVLASCN